MQNTRQLGFKILDEKSVSHFGGAYLKNSNAKIARPISLKRSMHLVLRSSKATGSRSFSKNSAAVFAVVNKQAKLFGVKVYRYANAGNHLHMVILPRSRKAFHGFVRAISGLIARLVLGVERGKIRLDEKNIDSKKHTNETHSQFWDKRPYTRIIEWGKDFTRVGQYLLQNTLEALGFTAYKPRVKAKQAHIKLNIKLNIKLKKSTSSS